MNGLLEGIRVLSLLHLNAPFVISTFLQSGYYSSKIVHAVRYGNRKLAGKLIETYSSYNFNDLHIQTLLNDHQPLKVSTYLRFCFSYSLTSRCQHCGSDKLCSLVQNVMTSEGGEYGYFVAVRLVFKRAGGRIYVIAHERSF